jgi:hypothetical protein
MAGSIPFTRSSLNSNPESGKIEFIAGQNPSTS